MNIRFFAPLIIVGLAAVVNATTGRSLESLVKEAEEKGEATVSKGLDVEKGGVPAGLPGKGLEVDAAEATDGSTHDFTVFFQNEKPSVVIFTAIRDEKRRSEYLNLYCDAKGKANKCIRMKGSRDESGKPIEGSLSSESLSEKERKAALQHELDFWLKGKYRKVAAKPAK